MIFADKFSNNTVHDVALYRSSAQFIQRFTVIYEWIDFHSISFSRRYSNVLILIERCVHLSVY